jgi:hypothetical protein
MPSPLCQVKDGAGAYQPTTDGVDVTPGNTVTINLISSAGVILWEIACITTDDESDAATVDASLVINQPAKTATFTAPAAGRAYRFRSRINSGIDANGVAQPTYTTTFGVYTLTLEGRSVVALDETFERHSTKGWGASINDVIRNPTAVTTPTGDGFYHITSGSPDAAARKVDITDNADVTAPTGTGIVHAVSGEIAAATKLIENADVHASAAIVPTKLSAGTNGNVIRTLGGAAGWGSLDLADSDCVGASLLPRANGGTGVDFSSLTGHARKVISVNTGETGFELANTVVDPSVNGLRLTLTTGTPITTSDVATATTIYLTPFLSDTIALFDGSVWVVRSTSEVSLALGTLTSGRNYDVFAYWNGSAVALELSAAWNADNVTRTDAITTQNGVQVKSGTTTRRRVGTIRTISTTQTTDSAAQRFVQNGPEPWRKIQRHLASPLETADNWTYAGGATFQQANANANNKVEYVAGDISLVQANVYALFASTSTTNFKSVGVGIDSTTTNSARRMGAQPAAVSTGMSVMMAFYEGYPAIGYHALNWLEAGSATITFYGDGGQPNLTQSGLSASILM